MFYGPNAVIYSVCYAPEPKSQERKNKCTSSTLLPDTLCRLLFLGTADFHKIGFPCTLIISSSLAELWPHQHHLCVYVIMHLCTCVCGCSSRCMYVWSPEVDTGCLSLSLSSFFSETGSLTVPGVSHFVLTDWPVSPLGS